MWYIILVQYQNEVDQSTVTKTMLVGEKQYNIWYQRALANKTTAFYKLYQSLNKAFVLRVNELLQVAEQVSYQTKG